MFNALHRAWAHINKSKHDKYKIKQTINSTKDAFLICLLKSPPSLFFFQHQQQRSLSLLSSAPPLSFPSVNLAAVISTGLADLTQEDGNIWILFSKIIPLHFSLPCWHTHKTIRAETPTAAPPNIMSALVFPCRAQVSSLIFYRRNTLFYF